MGSIANTFAAELVPDDLPQCPITDRQFAFFQDFAKSQMNITITDHKRNMVFRRVAQRLRALGFDRVDDYCAFLQTREADGETEHLINALTTNKTEFFRESHHFDHLASVVLPAIMADPAAQRCRRLRIWSAGCSSGQEPHSIAMTLADGVPGLSAWDSRILATDIDTEMVERARQGIYRAEDMAGIPLSLRQKYVDPLANDRGYCRMAPSIRSQIVFKPLNLFDPWPMKGPFDAIFCRNVVIYFDKIAQKCLFDRFADILKDGGFLYIGHSESLCSITDRFKAVGQSVYQKSF